MKNIEFEGVVTKIAILPTTLSTCNEFLYFLKLDSPKELVNSNLAVVTIHESFDGIYPNVNERVRGRVSIENNELTCPIILSIIE